MEKLNRIKLRNCMVKVKSGLKKAAYFFYQHIFSVFSNQSFAAGKNWYTGC